MFTYINATAPEMPEVSQFVTEYDGVPVDGDRKVIVESGKPASALAIVVDGFTIEDGPATVTVKLLDPDGELATRSTPTTVDLIASSGTIVSVTIPAGEYSMDTTLSAEEAANITITATATGLTDAEPLTVLADTNSPSIDADSITADPMYAKEGTTVTVSATGTQARAANTVLFSIHTGETPGPVADGVMEEDENQPGTYSADYPVAEGAHDGTYDITVKIEGTDVSVPATGALIIDTVLPVITDPSEGR